MSRLRSGAATCTCGWSSWMVPATPAGCRCFPDAERMVAAGHRADERRRRYIVAHAALRQVLQAYVHISAADLVFATSRFGKPRAVLPRLPPIHFSLSHGRRRCLIGIARGGDVGVDIEPIDRRGDISSMAIAVLSESEHARWRALSSRSCSDAILSSAPASVARWSAGSGPG
ncbi:4'-phosphopantetheinyl transferase family protein, partial [Bradyrhizobium elkanii]|uniref:4'-phosphopantetheinyl transferase family protein n=1 Tax=Bradyrhizobium elkanii TaxID=29448 RepID=UPI003BA9BA24